MTSGGRTVVVDARATTQHFPGVARATLGLLQGLHELDHSWNIAVLGHAGAPSPQLRLFADQRFCHIATSAGPLSASQQWRLPLLARALRPDIWHAPYYVRPFVGMPEPIVTVFDIIGHVLPAALPSLRARLLFELTMRLSLRRAAHVIVSSRATRRDLQAAFGIDAVSISVIPLATDERFRPQPRHLVQQLLERYSLPREYLLYLGSNKPHKNLPTLIRAFATTDTAARLVVAGRWDARYPEAREVVQQLQLTDRVRFLHNVSDDDVPALLSGALAFVFPSRYEGFGLPPLEAMACGAPVISSNAASLPEVVADAGLLVEPQVERLREAMQRAVDDPVLRDKMRERGLQRAALFSWQETARQTLAVYERVRPSQST